MLNPNTQFKKGESGNPAGRPKGALSSQLSRVKAIILAIFEENEALFEQKLRERAQRGILEYYHELITPLMPKDLNIDANINAKVSQILSKPEALERLNELEKLNSKTAKNNKKGS